MPIGKNTRKRNMGGSDQSVDGFGNPPEESEDIQTDLPETEHFDLSTAMPQDLADDLFEGGIAIPYKHTLYKLSNGEKTKRGSRELCRSWDNYYPTPDEVGSDYGTGDFIRYVTWIGKDENGEPKKKIKYIPFSVGGNYDIIAQQKRIQQQRELQASTMPTVQGGFNMNESLDMLGKVMALAPKADSGIAAIIPVIVQMQTQSMQMMLAQSDKTFQILMASMNNRPKEPTIADKIAEFKMFQEMMNPAPEKATMLEQIMEHGKDILIAYEPVIQEAVKKLNNPLLAPVAKRKILADEDFQALLADPEKRTLLIEHLYKTKDADEVDTALLKLGVITEDQRRGSV